MRAVIYTLTGGPEVLHTVERDLPVPGPGEVLVQVHFSGVNPTDTRVRSGTTPGAPLGFPEVVPHQDGAGLITAVGPNVPAARIGERVWLFEAAWQRANGTAAEYVAIDARHAVALPDTARFDLGAALGIPYLTAHRCLTVAGGGPARLSPGALRGRYVLVAGGAGVVGHAAIQLAKWAGATVIATVSSKDKADLASASGADVTVNYRGEGVTEQIRAAARDGVNLIVEVDPAANATLDRGVLAENGSISVYAGGAPLELEVRPMMLLNARYQFVFVYTIPREDKDNAVSDVAAALSDGALSVGATAGLPVLHYALEDTPLAHSAIEQHVLGKVLVDVIEPWTSEHGREATG